MSLEAEVLVDRRRISRRLTIWRFGAILLGISLLVALTARQGGLTDAISGSGQIARITIQGVITDNHTQQKMIDDLAKADHVKAVLMHVNSPGGTTTGGEALYASIRRLSEKKPVVAVFGTVAASAGYIVGLACDHIVTRGNTITGSVGVIFMVTQVSQLLDKIGVKVEEIKSGPLKATPSPFQPMDDAAREYTQQMVMESQRWFLDLVEERRSLTPLQMQELKDGRVYSGRQAVKKKLADQIGGEREAVKWLEETKKIEADLQIHDWEPGTTKTYGWLFGLAGRIETSLSLPTGTFTRLIGAGGPLERLRLDGLISIWQPISKS